MDNAAGQEFYCGLSTLQSLGWYDSIARSSCKITDQKNQSLGKPFKRWKGSVLHYMWDDKFWEGCWGTQGFPFVKYSLITLKLYKKRKYSLWPWKGKGITGVTPHLALQDLPLTYLYPYFINAEGYVDPILFCLKVQSLNPSQLHSHWKKKGNHFLRIIFS